MASGNSLRPWNLTKGKHNPPPRPGLDLGTLGEIIDKAGMYPGLHWLPTSDEIEFRYDKLTRSGIFDPARSGRRKK